MISCRDWWPRTKSGYITMTRRQRNNQWSGGIAAYPRPLNIPNAKIRWKFLASIFWDQDGILLTHYLPKGQTINAEFYSSLLVQLRDILKGKRRGRSSRGSCSCTTMPRPTGHLQPRRNWPTWTSNVLIIHPILRNWLRRTTTCSLDWKTIERSQFFVRRGGHCCLGDLVRRTNSWILLSGLQKLEQGVRSVLSFVGSMLNNSWVWSM